MLLRLLLNSDQAVYISVLIIKPKTTALLLTKAAFRKNQSKLFKRYKNKHSTVCESVCVSAWTGLYLDGWLPITFIRVRGSYATERRMTHNEEFTATP